MAELNKMLEETANYLLNHCFLPVSYTHLTLPTSGMV